MSLVLYNKLAKNVSYVKKQYLIRTEREIKEAIRKKNSTLEKTLNIQLVLFTVFYFEAIINKILLIQTTNGSSRDFFADSVKKKIKRLSLEDQVSYIFIYSIAIKYNISIIEKNGLIARTNLEPIVKKKLKNIKNPFLYKIYEEVSSKIKKIFPDYVKLRNKIAHGYFDGVLSIFENEKCTDIFQFISNIDIVKIRVDRDYLLVFQELIHIYIHSNKDIYTFYKKFYDKISSLEDRMSVDNLKREYSILVDRIHSKMLNR